MRFKHSKSVRFRDNGQSYYEYDQYDRVTFYLHHRSGYWSMSFFDEPKEGQKPNQVPYQVMHSYWNMYNGLK